MNFSETLLRYSIQAEWSFDIDFSFRQSRCASLLVSMCSKAFSKVCSEKQILSCIEHTDMISASCLSRYFFFAVPFSAHFSVLQFPSRRAKFRRDCDSASGIPPRISFRFSPLFLSSSSFSGIRDSLFRDSRGVGENKADSLA